RGKQPLAGGWWPGVESPVGEVEEANLRGQEQPTGTGHLPHPTEAGPAGPAAALPALARSAEGMDPTFLRRSRRRCFVRPAIWKAALLGAALGAAGCAVLFLTSDRRTLTNDWFLAVMVVFANASGFAVAAQYRVSLLGVALAGLAGMMV